MRMTKAVKFARDGFFLEKEFCNGIDIIGRRAVVIVKKHRHFLRGGTEQQFVVAVVKVGEVSFQYPAQNFFCLVQVNKAFGVNVTIARHTNERRFGNIARHGKSRLGAKIPAKFKDRDTVKTGRFDVSFHGVHINAASIKI